MDRDGQQKDSAPHLLSWWALVLMGAVLAALLVWLVPDTGKMHEQMGQSRGEQLALTYLRLAVADEPDNAALRLSLSRAYLAMGRLDDAENTLEPLMTAAGGDEARSLAREIARARCVAGDRDAGCATLPEAAPEKTTEAAPEKTAEATADATPETAPGAGSAGPVRRAPDALRAREAAARMADWSGQPLVALEHWAHLARRTRNPAHLQRAMTLARALWAQDLLAELMELEPASPDLQMELAALYRRIGRPERAAAVIDALIDEQPADRHFWDMRMDLQKATGDVAGAAATWAAMEQRFGMTEAEARGFAGFLWQAHRPREAFAVLSRKLGSGSGAEVESVRLLAELAWQLDRPERAREFYKTLWQRGAAGDDEVFRLLAAARTTGAVDLAVNLAAAGEHGHRSAAVRAEMVTQAMQIAADHGRWDDVERLTTRARADRLPMPRAYRQLCLAMIRELHGRAVDKREFAAALDLIARMDAEVARHAGEAAAGIRDAMINRTVYAALAAGEMTVAAALVDRATLPPVDRVHALVLLGREHEALAAARAAEPDAGDPEARAELARQSSALELRLPRRLSLHTRAVDMGEAVLLESGGGLVVSWNRWRLDTDVLGRYLFRAPALDLPAAQLEVTVTGRRRTATSNTWLTAGADVRERGVLPVLVLGHDRWLSPRLHVRARGALGQAAEQGASLFQETVRDHAEFFGFLRLGERYVARAYMGAHAYRLRHGERAGTGLQSRLSVQYRTGRRWHVELGSDSQALSCRLSELCGSGVSAHLLAMTVSLGEEDPMPGRGVSYHVAATAGWLMPDARVTYALAATVGVPLFGGDALTLGVESSSSLLRPSEPGAAWSQHSAMLRYTHRLWF